MGDLMELLVGGKNEIGDELYRSLLKKRIIYYNQDVSDSLIDMVALPILTWNIEEEDIPTEKLKPITIWLSTNGGDIIPTLYTIDVIQKSRIPIHVKVLAIAASAGLYLTIACHKRFGSKNTVYLLHKGSLSLGGDTSAVEDTMDFFKGPIDEKFVKLIVDKTKITEEELKKIRRNETYVLGEEALTYGFIDELY